LRDCDLIVPYDEFVTLQHVFFEALHKAIGAPHDLDMFYYFELLLEEHVRDFQVEAAAAAGAGAGAGAVGREGGGATTPFRGLRLEEHVSGLHMGPPPGVKAGKRGAARLPDPPLPPPRVRLRTLCTHTHTLSPIPPDHAALHRRGDGAVRGVPRRGLPERHD
jgi:hypothetical protein